MTMITRGAAAFAGALCGTLMLAACGGATARHANYMERGQKYFAEQNYEKARVEFRNAQQVSPKDPAARYMNGRVAEKLGNLRDAVGLYKSAVDLDPDHSAARASLGRLFVFGGAPERALEIVEPGLAKHPDDAELLTVRGAARIQLKNREGALADGERAHQLDPGNENAAALLASIYRQAGETGRAVDLIKATIEKSPKSVDLHLVLANLYDMAGEPDLAREELRKLVELQPKDLRYRQQLVQSYLRAKQPEAAEREFKAAVDALPDNDAAKLAYVDYLTSVKSPEVGERTLREFIARDPKNATLQFGLGGLQQRAKRHDEALATFRKVLADHPDGAQALLARNHIATVEVLKRNFDEAGRQIAEVLRQNPRDADALILRANVALERNDPAAAITDLRAVLRDQPGAVGLLRTLARAHVANGEPALAEESLRNAMEAAPNDVAVRIDLGALLAQNGRAAQGVPILEEAVKSAPADLFAREALVRAYVGANDLESARRAAEDLKLAGPQLATGPYLAGLIAQAQKRTDDAQREFERALQLQPTAMDALTALTRIDIERKRVPAALARIKSAMDADAENAVVRNLLGEVYLYSLQQPANAIEPLSQALAIAPRWWLPHRTLALAKLAMHDEAGAVAEYEAGVKATDYQAMLVTDLASIYEKQNRADDAIARYEELHKRNPRMELAANNLAMLLVTYRKDQASLDRARDLTAPFAGSRVGAYLDTHGWVRFKRGELSQALPVLERAVAATPDSRVIRFHLAMAQMKAGERDKAIANLERVLDGDKPFTGSDEARSVLAQLKSSSAG